MADATTEPDPKGNGNIVEQTTETSEEGIQEMTGDVTQGYHKDPDKPQDDPDEPLEEVVSISTSMVQNTTSSVVIRESSKLSDGNEMVFTVVAVDNNITDLLHRSLDPETFPKEVQLSLVQPGTLAASSVQVTAADEHADINQLALIAASIEDNPEGSKVPDSEKTSLSMVNLERSTAKRKSYHKSYQDTSESVKSDKGRVICTVCEQNFSDLPSMRRHRLIHSEEKPYQCDFCDKAFRRKDNLREHRNIHTQEHVYKCERCGKSFPRKYTHKVHMSRLCMKPGEVETESEDATWSNSMETERNQKPNVAGGGGKSSEPCEICLKTFRDASTLKRHLLTHSDERPYKCEECDKAFRRKDHLQEHVIVHKLVRPFSCRTCGKSFSRKNGLKTHMIRTTHLLGFDEIILPSESKSSSDVEAHVVEHVFAADQLLATSNEVFPEESGAENVDQPTSDKDTNETGPQPDDSDEPSTAARLDFSKVQTNSGNLMETEKVETSSENLMETEKVETNSENLIEAETTVVLSEKHAEPTELENPENDGLQVPMDDPDGQDLQSIVAKSFACSTCNEIFPSKYELWKHSQEHLAENMFACQHCFEVFDSTELLEEHQKACDGGEDENSMRGDDFQTDGDQTVNSADDSLNDETIGVASQTSPISGKRKRIDTPERLDQTCTICNKIFRDNTALKRHVLVHSGERPHACSHCDKRFRRRDHLKAHETAYHSGKTLHECKTCDAVFNTRYALTVHTKTCTNRPVSPKDPVSEEAKLVGSPESKSCPVCHKTFKDASTQRRHFRIHSDERPFNCSVCSKSFRRKDNLKEHLFCHSEDKPFSCNECGKSLSRRSSLTNHMTICPARKAVGASSVTGENPIIPEMEFAEPAAQDMCVHGDTQGISPADLMTTTDMTSSGVTSLDVTTSGMTSSEVMEDGMEHGLDEDDGSGNSFPCSECGKIFRAKWTLKFHQRIHTGEKPYTCTTCDRQFRQPSHLKIHERTHSGERPYHCQICGRAFIDSSTMRRHERLHKDAADPNAIIDEQHDVIKGQEYVISNQDDVISDPNEAIDNMNGNEPNIVQQAVEVSIQDSLGEDAIQLLVTTANELANSTQPISTNVVPEMNQSDEGQTLGTRIDENNIGQILRACIRNQQISTEKIETLEEITWQQNSSGEAVEQLIYIQTEDPAPTAE